VITSLAALPAANIKVGDHPTGHVFGLAFNIDTVYTTAIAAVVTVLFMLMVARKVSDVVPNKVQVLVEAVVDQTKKFVEDAVGHDIPPWLVPLGVTLFFFILFCNWLAWIPSGHDPERLGPPTADTNLVYAMTFVVVVLYTYLGIKRKRVGGYVKGIVTAPFPRNVILILEQVINPVSLSLRLFGNIFAGGIMLAVIALLPEYLFFLYGPFNVIWKLFDSGFIAPIQAFIYAFLTILYFGFATAEEH
jgi:F-type H+-transporting ATPase subunit a